MEGKNKYPYAVEVSEGYILINDHKTAETFNTLVEQGVFWEQISVLLKEYANPSDKEDEVYNMLYKMSRQINTVMENQKALPAPLNVDSSEYKENVVEAKSIQIEEIKPKSAKGHGSLFNVAKNFGKMK